MRVTLEHEECVEKEVEEQLGKPLYASLSLAVTTITLMAMFLALGSYEFLARRLPGHSSG